ncbi:MAG TPA: prepilin-type N-terminal cleavage/methylation domain-containing protein [Candidatus Wallbacteria bacterium]|nr:prepilin-type N-terminal cleavage/methylation domain-containing protein [Candidatus Wallbacteria bacterium]
MNISLTLINKYKKAFTLVEIMVVVFLSSLLIIALYDLFWYSFKGVLAGKTKLGNLQDAAITMEHLKVDIKGAYLKKSNIKGQEIDGESLLKTGDGILEFSTLVYDQDGSERLIKIAYNFDQKDESLYRTEEGGPTRVFAKGKIKRFFTKLMKIDNISYIDTSIKVEEENKQKVELRNAIFPKDVQAVNKHWIPNPY